MSTHYCDDHTVSLPEEIRARLEGLNSQTGLDFIVTLTTEPDQKTGQSFNARLTVHSVTAGRTFDRPPRPTIRVLGNCASGACRGRDFELVFEPASTTARLTVYNRATASPL